MIEEQELRLIPVSFLDKSVPCWDSNKPQGKGAERKANDIVWKLQCDKTSIFSGNSKNSILIRGHDSIIICHFT